MGESCAKANAQGRKMGRSRLENWTARDLIGLMVDRQAN